MTELTESHCVQTTVTHRKPQIELVQVETKNLWTDSDLVVVCMSDAFSEGPTTNPYRTHTAHALRSILST